MNMTINEIIKHALRNGCDYFYDSTFGVFNSRIETPVMYDMYFIVSSVNPYNKLRYYSVMGYSKESARVYRAIDRSFCTLKGAKIALHKMMGEWA